MLSMSTIEILGLVLSLLGFIIFAIIFTLVYRSYTKSYIKAIEDKNEDKNILDDLIRYNHPKNKKKRKIVKAIKNIIFYGLIILLIPFFIISLFSRIRGNILTFGDTGYLVVASGSMSQRNNNYLEENNLNNQFDTGDIIQIKRLSSSDTLKLYDVISFKDDKGMNIIHRIIKIDENGTYTTRGDSNLGSDTYHPNKSDVYGVYTDYKIPKIGYLVMFFKSNFGIMTVIALIYCLLMVEFFNKKSEEKYEIRKKEIDDLISDKKLEYDILYDQLEKNRLDYEDVLSIKEENNASNVIDAENKIESQDDNKESEMEIDSEE